MKIVVTKIEIQNNVQNIKIDVKKNEEGSFAILISEEKVEESRRENSRQYKAWRYRDWRPHEKL